MTKFIKKGYDLNQYIIVPDKEGTYVAFDRYHNNYLKGIESNYVVMLETKYNPDDIRTKDEIDFNNSFSLTGNKTRKKMLNLLGNNKSECVAFNYILRKGKFRVYQRPDGTFTPKLFELDITINNFSKQVHVSKNTIYKLYKLMREHKMGINLSGRVILSPAFLCNGNISVRHNTFTYFYQLFNKGKQQYTNRVNHCKHNKSSSK